MQSSLYVIELIYVIMILMILIEKFEIGNVISLSHRTGLAL
jgi:hypothetical protein